jgi:hypothetical protein
MSLEINTLMYLICDAKYQVRRRVEGVEPALTGRPSNHPEVMLKIYMLTDPDARSIKTRGPGGVGYNV